LSFGNGGQDYLLYADLFNRQGNKPKAIENLNKTLGIFKECGTDGWVERYKKRIGFAIVKDFAYDNN
jgi:hypothetical protein